MLDGSFNLLTLRVWGKGRCLNERGLYFKWNRTPFSLEISLRLNKPSRLLRDMHNRLLTSFFSFSASGYKLDTFSRNPPLLKKLIDNILKCFWVTKCLPSTRWGWLSHLFLSLLKEFYRWEFCSNFITCLKSDKPGEVLAYPFFVFIVTKKTFYQRFASIITAIRGKVHW